MPFDPTQSYGTISDTHPPLYIQSGVIYRSDTLAVVNDTAPYVYTRSGSAVNALTLIAQNGIPVFMAPSGYFANNGVYILGQAPSNSATVSFSATSGTGVTMTFSAATLLGTSVDVGRVVTILDTTYKYATITTQSSTTVATVTLTGTLSGTGPFANASTWLSGPLVSQVNAVAFSALLRTSFPNLYFYFPVNVISAATAAGVYYAQPLAGGPTPGTVFTVYNNPLTSGVPTIPATPAAFVTTGPGAFSQTTGSAVTLVSLQIPANSMGPNGRLHLTFNEVNNNSANNKTATVSYGGVNVIVNNITSGFNSEAFDHTIINSGVTNAQQCPAGVGSGLAGNPPALNIDTTAIVNLNFLGTLVNANDWMGLNYFVVELTPA